ncbi:unnamed protein product, partial [Effrenium voratum]
MSSKDEGISTAPSSEGSGPDTWVVRNTFLELSEREVGDASHRAASDPGLRRSKQEPEAKVEEQDPAPDWSQVALLEAERRELAEELAKVHVHHGRCTGAAPFRRLPFFGVGMGDQEGRGT